MSVSDRVIADRVCSGLASGEAASIAAAASTQVQAQVEISSPRRIRSPPSGLPRVVERIRVALPPRGSDDAKALSTPDQGHSTQRLAVGLQVRLNAGPTAC